MKALTIKQPWASLIAHGIKDIENRTWKTKYRGRIYIHAAAHPAFEGYYQDHLPAAYWGTLTGNEKMKHIMGFAVRGAIIGEVDIVDCVLNHPSIWAEKSIPSKDWHKEGNLYVYNWVLANPVLYDQPILNIKGRLSFWEYSI